MMTLISTIVSFLMGGVPKILDFMQDRSDKKHEIQLAQMQLTQQIEMQKQGFVAQQQTAAIEFEGLKVDAEVRQGQQHLDEKLALLAHDTASAVGASQWVINARAMVRPAITYGMFLLLAFVDIFGFYYAIHTGVGFDTALNLLWDDDSQQIFASIISFYFGSQAFKK
jgi:hypothetical protein